MARIAGLYFAASTLSTARTRQTDCNTECIQRSMLPANWYSGHPGDVPASRNGQNGQDSAIEDNKEKAALKQGSMQI
ncbi:hypothetical protein BaRGS_00002362 [Batillaria attramentaria]|uniref:Secreted protein n=1 Tax=Batillaria attramentaria TaxID=370345 RepID=A0ABD0M441_9CAEN